MTRSERRMFNFLLSLASDFEHDQKAQIADLVTPGVFRRYLKSTAEEIREFLGELEHD